MKNINEFLSSIVSEAALDARISDGMVDLGNIEHVIVVAECMENRGVGEQMVEEFVTELVSEGKYPDRQAFNKDGWLVTFPSKEYRDAAIKKGTHSISDPTHGKGGMNLYYKKRGKQKRQTQQVASTVDTVPQQPVKKPTPAQPEKQQPQKKQRAAGEITPEMMGDTPEESPTQPADAQPTAQEAPPQEKQPTTSPVTKKEPEQPTEPTAQAPAVDVPVVTTPPEQYSEISKKFALKKGWISEPYGEYRDSQGNTVAVVGLSGEIVPIKSVDREEYKLFAEKSLS